MRRTAFLKLATALVTAATVLAQPTLTTIQDTLYKADGTPFNGLLIISWNSFQADNQANIVSQSLTVRVVNGYFRVQLAPTADANPPSSYTVTYNSDGKIQFQETWVVGPSSTPVTIADVRVSTTSAPSNSSPVQPGNQTPIAESAVTGLTNDLSIRPMKGTGFSVGRAAMINSAGGIDAVIGNPSDCVFVDGTSGAAAPARSSPTRKCRAERSTATTRRSPWPTRQAPPRVSRCSGTAWHRSLRSTMH